MDYEEYIDSLTMEQLHNKMNQMLRQLTDPVSDNLTDFQTPPPPRDAENYDYVMYYEDLTAVQKPWTEDKAFWPTIVTYGFTFSLGIIGNALVCFALLLDKKSRNVTSYFLVCLALADLAFLVICVPHETLVELKQVWAGGPVLCKVGAFVEMLSTSASVLNLMAVSIERYIVIVHPMKSRSWCTMGNTKKIIIALWVIAFLLSSPILHIMDTSMDLYYNNQTYTVTISCMEYNTRSPNDRIVFAYYQLIIMFILPVLIMVFCYSVVIYVLWSSTKQLAKMTSSLRSHDDRSHSRVNTLTNRVGSQPVAKSLLSRPVNDHSAQMRKARKQVIKMLLTIISVFFICWGPKLILNVLKRHEFPFLHKDEAFYVSLVINLLPYAHSCLNPIIYSFMSKNFRRSMCSCCQLHCHCLPSNCSQKHHKHSVCHCPPSNCQTHHKHSVQYEMSNKNVKCQHLQNSPTKSGCHMYTTVMTDNY